MKNDPGTLGPDPDDLAAEVRRRLHQAVSDVQPAPDALDRLRAAVPARRRQRRMATLGAAGLAAAILVGTPVLRTAVTGGEDSRSNVGGVHPSSSVVNATEPLPGPSDGVSAGLPGAGQTRPASRGSSPTSGSGSSTAPTGGQTAGTGTGQSVPPSSSVSPSETAPPVKPPPACRTVDMSGEDARLGPVRADGLAYGVLQVRSNAAKDCVVTGPGVVVVVSPPGNPIVQVTVVQAPSPDAATALPVPSSSAQGITLRPGQAYEFQFAWKPQPPGADGTCAADAPKAPVPALGYALAADDFNVAKVTLTPTCGGTVYRTDIYRTGEYARVG
ncbi:hypothetical protein [Embleya hyalina]|uniref:DUF4232 domain-containing protein n=1 Tax=Embleya hyalina TaxID=516124 RepID=A0A401YRD8_9ACTN|nr:hypothetical protein [Embleya hyalina]GCD97163.1 hypothetical protein EHYA_04853 [Embleya hyalina]